METLRTEILETQKVRSDLLKWKLIIVSALGGAGLGLSGNTGTVDASLVLCVIPFSCAYVDLLCRHLSIRNKIIGVFLSKQKGVSSSDALVFDYEYFYSSIVKEVLKKKTFEDYAVFLSSFFISLLSTTVGIVISGFKFSCGFSGLMQFPTSLFVGSGVCGIILLIAVEMTYKKWVCTLDELSVVVKKDSCRLNI